MDILDILLKLPQPIMGLFLPFEVQFESVLNELGGQNW